MIDDLVQSAGMSGGRTRPMGSRARRHEAGVKLIAPGASTAEEQAAAVCYRIHNARIEFLLVRTRKRRWTFPKGGVDPGLTPAETASQEAWEEAGVDGLVEETEFAQYVLEKQGDFGEGAETEVTVHAYLCEVLQLDEPQEPYRCPTWFSAQQAKRRLKEQRAPQTAAQLARVVELAVARIQQLQLQREAQPHRS